LMGEGFAYSINTARYSAIRPIPLARGR
jgi:hypothetical protein